MAYLDSQQKEQYENIRDIKDQIAEEFLKRPGIRGVGVGYKYIDGRQSSELAIRFYVKEKRTVSLDFAIPTKTQGVATDVIEANLRKLPTAVSTKDRAPSPEAAAPPATSQAKSRDSHKDKHDPLLGGISIGLSREIDGGYGVGTLGLMVSDDITSALMMLSNQHVMCDSDGKARRGDEICQPGRPDRTIGYCSNCAKLERWFVGNTPDPKSNREEGVDAAVASLTHRSGNTKKILGLPAAVSGSESAQMGMNVLKVGRSTTRTSGKIIDIAYDGKEDFGPPYGYKILKNQIVIRPDAGAFSLDGDSGSVLINQANMRVVGLLWGGDDKNHSVASPIAAVLRSMQVQI